MTQLTQTLNMRLERAPPVQCIDRLQRAHHDCPQCNTPSLHYPRTGSAAKANLDPNRSQPRFQGTAPGPGHHRLVNKYKSTYKSNISRQEGKFSGAFGFPHNKQKQDELPPPYPQHLCPILLWQHPPWYQIIAQQLLMSPSKVPGGGFPITAAGSFAWGAKT
jgi:hypothetical protein